jgi:poly-gamma-glutamate capsule biosynthesis protein CapA/YwtB (metallophosphatase superfamily)
VAVHRVWLVLALGLTLSCQGSPAAQTREPVLDTVVPTQNEPTPVPPTLVPTPAFLEPEQVPPLSIEGIFSPADGYALLLDPSRVRTLIATGDVIPARRVDGQIRAREDDFLYPVAATAEVLVEADLTLINLEAPLIENCPQHDRGFMFCGQSGFVDALVHAGVDIAGMENNHISNYGPDGISETRSLLTDHGIDMVDRSTLAVRDVRGLRFGFLAFNGVGEYFDRPAIVQAVEAARPQVDVLVVSFHWGAEYVAIPEVAPGIAPDDPVEIGHLAVDAGADLVIGNHPHWVQAVELYNGNLITYAHGNFIFDQSWSRETLEGVVGRYTFYDDRLVQVEFLPVVIANESQPRFVSGSDAETILNRMHEASDELGDRLGKP